MTTQPFFMVYLENEKTPTFIHTTLDSAENEAKRLARIYKKKALVLCSIKSLDKKEIFFKRIKRENEP